MQETQCLLPIWYSGRQLMAGDGQMRHIRWSTTTGEQKMEKDEIVPILKPCPFCGDLWQTDRFAPDHDLHLRASAPRPLGEDG